jgi:hypothetical protein
VHPLGMKLCDLTAVALTATPLSSTSPRVA